LGMIQNITRANNFVNGTPADAEAVDADFDALYTKLSEILYAFSSASIGESIAEKMNCAPIDGLIDGTIYEKLADIKSQLGIAVTGTIPNASLEAIKLVVEFQRFLKSTRKENANSMAIHDKNGLAIPSTNNIYDLLDNTNSYSCGKLDTLKTITTLPLSVGATSITVDDATGIVANNEYTIQQYNKMQSFVVTSVSGKVLTVPALVNDFGVGAAVYRSNVILDQGRMVFGTVKSGTFPVKITDPSLLPAGTVNGVAYSPDGKWLAVASGSTPYLILYKRTGDVFLKQPDLDGKPTSDCYCVAFSPNGKYFTVGTSGSTTVHYKIVDDVFTKLTRPVSYPSGTVYGADYSEDGTYLALSQSSSPYLVIYKIDDVVFTKLPDPETKPTAACHGIKFSHNGIYLAVSSDASPYMLVYKRTGDVFDKISNPASLPTGDGNGLAWGKNDEYLAVAHEATPFVTIYKRTSDTFAKLANPSTLPTGNGFGAAFSKDGSYLVIAHAVTPFVTMYDRLNDTFSAMPDPITPPTDDAKCVTFGLDDLFLTIGHDGNPYISTYKCGTKVATVDVRYNVTPTNPTKEVDVWLYREKDASFSIAPSLSIVDSANPESYSSMTKTTTEISSDLILEELVGTSTVSASKVTAKFVLTKDTSVDKAITKLLGSAV